jgi:hypothetical protein
MNTLAKTHYYFSTGDCRGCLHYDVIDDCHIGHCESIRTCYAIELNTGFDDCKQYQEELRNAPSN